MGISPNSILLHNFHVEDLMSYLRLTGWEPAKPAGDRWLVFEGIGDIKDKPLEIVLPQDTHAPDIRTYLANAVNILAAVTEEPPETITRRIRLHDRDVLNVRNLETDEQDSIALKLASKQVSELKSLVGYSACSEQDPKPHFDTLLGIGKRITERYRFGHTFSGSFGFTVESPPIGRPIIYRRATQDSLIPEIVEEEIVSLLPFGRRVMERIVRGLLATQRATRERDVSILVNEYPSGFNSKMCAAVLKMSRDKALPLEYTVLWSPKIESLDDIRTPGAIRLSGTSYQYLEEAEHRLREIEPEIVTVRGLVTSLRSRDDPLEVGTVRSVVINWINRPHGERPVGVIVSLGREDYILAHKAHLNWSTVEVTGAVQKVGSSWRLSEPHNFRVVRE
jgi:hypothetical protein